MVCRDGVENEIETSGCGLHAVCVGGNHEGLGAELEGGVFLRGRRGDGGDFVSHGGGQTNAHLAETADADYADPKISLESAPMSERRIERDAGAEDGTRSLERISVRNS